MPRIPRRLIVYPGYDVHKVWRGHNREWNLQYPNEKLKYLSLMMDEHKKGKANPVQALCLMSNHTHEMLHIEQVKEFSNQMRRHHSKFGQYFNRVNNRCGKVAQDRPRTSLIGDEEHSMNVTFYIHANPLRAKMKKDAKDYLWSTHKLYAFGKRPSWLKHFVWPSWYLSLGKNPAQRQKRYRKLFDAYLRKDGLIQQTSFYKYFIGPALWKIPLEDKLTQWRKQHAPPEDLD